MLVGAGEIDAAMLVVAADDGPRAQTVEHLELLDGLSIDAGIAVITKTDVAGPERVREVELAIAPVARRNVARRVSGAARLFGQRVRSRPASSGPDGPARPRSGADRAAPWRVVGPVPAGDRSELRREGPWRGRDRHAPWRSAPPRCDAAPASRVPARPGPASCRSTARAWTPPNEDASRSISPGSTPRTSIAVSS